MIRAFNTLDWGSRLRFFRPRGLALDPAHEDIAAVVAAAGKNLDGLIFPKTETPDEVRSIDATLTALERKHGLPEGKISIQVLIESVSAEEQVFEIARSSRRLVGAHLRGVRLLGFAPHDRRALPHRSSAGGSRAGAHREGGGQRQHPGDRRDDAQLPDEGEVARPRRPPRSTSAGRTPSCARSFGFRGKWTGIPAQTEIAIEVFSIDPAVIERAVTAAKAFLEAESKGLGATMIDGKMADRATDRIDRVALKTAFALGKLDGATAAELGLK